MEVITVAEDTLTEERRNEIHNRLMAFTTPIRGQNVLFETLGYTDERTAKEMVKIRFLIEDTDLVVVKDVEDAKASDGVLDFIGQDLKRMLVLADEHGRSGFLNPLIPKEMGG